MARAVYVRQMRAMTRKNWLFSLRSWKTTLLQLLAPCLFVILLVSMDALPKSGDFNPYNPFSQVLDQPVIGIGKVPRCRSFNGLPCKTIRYSLDSTDQQDIDNLEIVMGCIKEDNGFNDDDVAFIGSSKELQDYAAKYPNTTLLGLAFYSLSGNFFSYNIFFNASYNGLDAVDIRRKPDGRNEMQLSVDRSLMRFRLNAPVEVDLSTKQFPQLGYSSGGLDTAAQYGTIFFYCGIMFQYVILLYNICMEKDLSLRRGLKMIGLKDSVYWLSWYITAIIICVIATLVLIASGTAANFQFFRNTDFSVNFTLFLLYSLAIISLATFTSVFIQKAKSSLNMGMGVFVLGLLFVSIVGNTYTVQAIYDETLVTRAVPIIFSFIAPFNLAKAMADINTAYSTQDTSGTAKNATRYTWDSLYQVQCIPKTVDGQYFCQPLPSTYESFILLLLDFLLFALLTWYFDNVMPSSNGEPRPLWFFLQPSYYGLNLFDKTTKSVDAWDSDETSALLPTNMSPSKKTSNYSSSVNSFGEDDLQEDPDVIAERRAALEPINHVPLRIGNIEKIFRTYSLGSLLRCRAATTHIAVDRLCLVAQESQILTLLGHNGAGKTTVINMLTGMMSSSEGDALVYGLSVKNDMDIIRNTLGVCPQHDILWNDLTAKEHMEIFCDLRCIPFNEVDDIIRERLEDVQLYDVRNNAVGTFSGGMKRRLSVALSFVGDPKIVFLDEPTTGMDPYIRRDIWNLILRLKKGRVIVMTTHSMEEADVLADKIAVMALGKLRCVGSSIHLKNRFAGYKMNLVVNRAAVEQVNELIVAHLSEAKLVRESVVDNVCYLNYSLPPQVTDRLVPFFELIESRTDIIKDFSISQTTLEEVFVNVTSESEYLSTMSRLQS